jgi:predicted 3-demethylubiquinone-9 3-methyltransferase (glyoxalase superfamily)
LPDAAATPPPDRVAALDAVVALLMFTGDAEEAMRFYASIFTPARIERIERYGPGEQGTEGTVKHATLRVGDRTIHFIDSPAVHQFTFTPSISLSVRGASVAAVDGIFARLSEGGTILMALDRYPFSERFGWVTDRFGVSWQVTIGPRADV